MDSMIHYNSNEYKRADYVTDLCNCNFKNNFDATIANISIKRDHINSSCVYSNIDNKRQNLILQLFSAVGNIEATTSISDPPISTIISYRNKNQLILLNDWENPHFFTVVFPWLFSFRNSGHLKQQKGPMLLEIWAK